MAGGGKRRDAVVQLRHSLVPGVGGKCGFQGGKLVTDVPGAGLPGQGERVAGVRGHLVQVPALDTERCELGQDRATAARGQRLREGRYKRLFRQVRALPGPPLPDLREQARRRVDRISGGQAQRLKVALVAVAGADTTVYLLPP